MTTRWWMNSGLLGLGIYLLFCFQPEWFCVWDPLSSDMNLLAWPSSPSFDHWFGTDDRGRDVWARLVYGTRVSFGFAALVWAASYGLGIGVGLFAGFVGGWVDILTQRTIDVMESLPYLFVVLVLVSSLGSSLALLILVNVLFGWMMIAAYTRNLVRKQALHPSVEAAKAVGAGPARILFVHLLPSSLFPVLVFSPLAMASYVSTFVQLDFLGLGLGPPEPSWGELLSQGVRLNTRAWWIMVFPAAFVSILLFSFQQAGRALKARGGGVSVVPDTGMGCLESPIGRLSG